LRARCSKELADEDGVVVAELATALIASRLPGARMTAYGILGHHHAALRQLDAAELERLATPLDSWGAVDMFGCLLAGRAWRDGAIPTSAVHGWARSKDRWWRRLALVCTVPLNVKSQGGLGDAKRTLAVCTLLIADRDDMVVKALSWALRELATRDPDAVSAFLEKHGKALAPRVNREVQNKLRTGRKTRRLPEAARTAPRKVTRGRTQS
jgi:3-methyladenine DNA glycosylase AlkD